MKPLLSADQLSRRVAELGAQLAADYRGRALTVVGILSGSVVFLADLIRCIDVPHQIGFVEASSYRGPSTTGSDLTVSVDRLPDLSGRDVLLIDDILDTGRTIAALKDLLAARTPASVRTAVLLWKEGRQQVDFAPDYYGFRIPDAFVVGYGLDYNNDYRHRPDIVILEPQDL
jgi:hypoxanthine phosphoribosyltransferase